MPEALHDAKRAAQDVADKRLPPGSYRRELLLTPWRVYRNFTHDNGFKWAAAMAYYGLLSVFPLVLLTIALAAFMVEAQWAVDKASELLENVIPGRQAEIKQLIDGAIELRARATVISLATLLFTGLQVFSIVTQALNVAYDVGQQYVWWKRYLIMLGQAVLIGTLFIIGLAARVLLDVFWGQLGLMQGEADLAASVVRWVLPLALLVLAFFLTYRYVPRREVSHRAALAGAITATALLTAARPIFLSYVDRFSEYNLLYGSLTFLIILVLWAWLVAIILLLGGHVSAHAQKVLIEGQAAEEVERRHELRSPGRGPDPAVEMVPEVKKKEERL